MTAQGNDLFDPNSDFLADLGLSVSVNSTSAPVRPTSDSAHSGSPEEDSNDVSFQMNSTLHTLFKRAFFNNRPNLVIFASDISALRRTEQGVYDAVTLAMAGLQGVDLYPDSYARYFPPGGECRIRSVFRRILGNSDAPRDTAAGAFINYIIYYQCSPNPSF